MKEVASVFKVKPAQVVASRRGQEFATSATPSSTNLWQQLTARVRSWFEIPYGYEDESGFHYGHEPRPNQSAPSAKVFTDRACDAMLSLSPTLTAADVTSIEPYPAIKR